MRKYFTINNIPAIVSLFALLLVLPATIFLVQQKQLFIGKAAEDVSLTLAAPQLISLGQTFRVEIKLDTGNRTIPTTGTDVILRYAPDVSLQTQTASPAAIPKIKPLKIIPGNTYDTYPVQEINTENKTIRISGSASNITNYFSGSGTFASIEFQAIRTGPTNISFFWSEGATDDTNVVGLVGGQPQERLVSKPPPLSLQIVELTLSWVNIHTNCQVESIPVNSKCDFSALAYSADNRPLWTGVSYEWGISSNNSIGTLAQIYGNITQFKAQRPGSGDIYVIAKQGDRMEAAGRHLVVYAHPPSPAPTPSPIPSPTPICKVGVNSFSVYNPCPGGFRNAKYVCYDGFSETLGDPTSCKPSATWREYAEEACEGRSSCPTPPPSPITCTPEGEIMPVYPGYRCCEGSKPISTAKPDENGSCPIHPPLGASVCAKCGNGTCGPGENKCNCPQDCTKCRAEDDNCTPSDVPCCEGLKEVALCVPDDSGRCACTNCGSICRPCGNGVCDENENKCSCPEDCSAPAYLNFSLVLGGRGACGFASQVSIYASSIATPSAIGSFDLLGKTQTDIVGNGTLPLKHIGITYQLFARTLSHLRKKALSIITIQKGNNYVDFGGLIPGDLFIAPGESEQDNTINNFDVAELFRKWGPASISKSSIPSPIDLNCDGMVNTWDLKIIFENFGKSGDGP